MGQDVAREHYAQSSNVFVLAAAPQSANSCELRLRKEQEDLQLCQADHDVQRRR
jgi:hypothetical protein